MCKVSTLPALQDTSLLVSVEVQDPTTAPTPPGYYPLNDPCEGWKAGKGAGDQLPCATGQVACGACMSDKHSHCGGKQGDGTFAQLKCCEAMPFEISGMWGAAIPIPTDPK
ncbi:MAG: hypothetical protein SGILL_004485 [Bacillariaceae sp.]